MPFYKLSGKALRDVAGILGYLHINASSSLADRTENRLVSVFHDLGTGKRIGHTRADMTNRQILFYFSAPQMIMLRKTQFGVQIIRVANMTQDLKRFL